MDSPEDGHDTDFTKSLHRTTDASMNGIRNTGYDNSVRVVTIGGITRYAD
jgi:hypothetical protein